MSPINSFQSIVIYNFVKEEKENVKLKYIYIKIFPELWFFDLVLLIFIKKSEFKVSQSEKKIEIKKFN